MTKAAWDNRIVGHGDAAVKDILFNPFNWRIHPKLQKEALRDAIRERGFIRSVTINNVTGHLVDGHLRVLVADEEGQETIPAEYVELSPEEELKALLELDPISAAAAADKEKLDEVLREYTTENAALTQLMAELAEREGITPPNVEFKEFDESVENEVEYITCPECGHKWPK